MDGGNRQSKADKLLTKRKKLKLWHQLLLIASSIVVFITTYMLILPAITAEIGTLNIYDECLSSGSVIVSSGVNNLESEQVDVCPIETTSEETTEEKPSSLGSGSGSGSGSEGVLVDGVVIDVTLEKVENEEKEVVNESLLEKVMSVLALGDGVSITTSGSGDDGGYVCTYNPDTGEFELGLNIAFTIPQSVLGNDYNTDIITENDCHKSYTVALPSDIVVPESLLGNMYIGNKTGTTEPAFRYYFEPIYDEDDNIINYQLTMVFLDSYLETLVGDNGTLYDINGEVKLNANVSVNAYQEDGTIVIKDDELGFDITIDKDDIKFDSNETINCDVMVTKKGSYNSSEKTVTYEVMVLSRKGTGVDPIYIKDSFSELNVLSALDAELLNIEYKQGVVGVAKYSYGTIISENRTTYDGPYQIEYRDDSTAQDVHYFYDRDSDDELLDDSLIIVFPSLEGVEGKYLPYDYSTEENSDFDNYNAYVITYKYSVDPSVGDDYSFTNTAAAKIHDDIADTYIEDSSFSVVRVTGRTLITKAGSYNSTNKEITWTITVGDGDENEASLKDYKLFDEMFADLTEAELKAAIKNADGTVVSESDYTIIFDNDVIKGIQFNAGYKYIIEYKTPVTPSWGGEHIENNVDLVPGDESESSYGDGEKVWISGESDCFNKVLDSAELNADETSYTLKWNTTFNVPLNGIPAGITFTDCLDGTGHYITYAQAQAIAATLKAAWGNDNIKDIQFYTGTNRWSMDESLWVNSDSLTEDAKYYQFRFTTVNKIVRTDSGISSSDTVNVYDKETIDGETVVFIDKIDYSYSTTADISSVTESQIYKNTLGCSGASTTKSAEWSYALKVVKYGYDSSGNLKTGTADATTTDGTATWVVKVILDSDFDSYTITDTLPAGVTLSELYMSKVGNYTYSKVVIEDGNSTSLFDDCLNVIYNSDSTTGQQVITLKADRTSNSVNTLYIKYVCKIDDTNESHNTDEDSDVKTDKTYNLTNGVKVTANGESETEYGSDTQTLNVTWTEESHSEDNLTKDAEFDKNNNIIKYSLDINPEVT